MKELAWLYGRHRDYDRDRLRIAGQSLSNTSVESGSLELEEEVVPASTPLVNVGEKKSERGWKLLPESSLVADVHSRILKTRSGEYQHP